MGFAAGAPGPALSTRVEADRGHPKARHEGSFAHVVLVPDGEAGFMRMLAFSIGKPIDGDPNQLLRITVAGVAQPDVGPAALLRSDRRCLRPRP